MPATARLLLLLGLTTCLPAAQADSGWRHGWGMAQARTDASASTAAPQLRLLARGGQTDVLVIHAGAGPLQVRLRNRGPALPGLPLVHQLAGPGHHRLLALPPGPASQLILDAVPGQPGARHDHPAYDLPFDDHLPVRVHQGNHGHQSHSDRQNRHAWDFALPEGTPVLAAREGLVMAVHGQATGPTRVPGDGGNWVRISHPDGTMAVYAHLQPGSLTVRPGQRIRRRQMLARSGNTGHSTAPHLHFVVQRNAGMALESLPVELNGPQGRLQAARGDGAARP